MSTEALTRLNRNNQRRNRHFNNLSPAGKRIAIAKDVLKQIQAKVIKPTSGLYLNLNKTLKAKAGTELQTLFTTQVKSCSACAVGSMLFCSIVKGDKLTIDKAQCSDNNYGTDKFEFGGDSGKDSFNHLEQYFPLSELKDIENRFELCDSMYHTSYCWSCSPLNISRISDCGKPKDPGDTGRLIAIMKNIIRNGGKFNKKEE